MSATKEKILDRLKELIVEDERAMEEFKFRFLEGIDLITIQHVSPRDIEVKEEEAVLPKPV